MRIQAGSSSEISHERPIASSHDELKLLLFMFRCGEIFYLTRMNDSSVSKIWTNQ